MDILEDKLKQNLMNKYVNKNPNNEAELDEDITDTLNPSKASQLDDLLKQQTKQLNNGLDLGRPDTKYYNLEDTDDEEESANQQTQYQKPIKDLSSGETELAEADNEINRETTISDKIKSGDYKGESSDYFEQSKDILLATSKLEQEKSRNLSLGGYITSAEQDRINIESQVASQKAEFEQKSKEMNQIKAVKDQNLKDNYEITNLQLALTNERGAILSYNKHYWNFLEQSGYISKSTRAAVDLSMSRVEAAKKLNYEQLMNQYEFEKKKKALDAQYQIENIRLANQMELQRRKQLIELQKQAELYDASIPPEFFENQFANRFLQGLVTNNVGRMGTTTGGFGNAWIMGWEALKDFGYTTAYGAGNFLHIVDDKTAQKAFQRLSIEQSTRGRYLTANSFDELTADHNWGGVLNYFALATVESLPQMIPDVIFAVGTSGISKLVTAGAKLVGSAALKKFGTSILARMEMAEAARLAGRPMGLAASSIGKGVGTILEANFRNGVDYSLYMLVDGYFRGQELRLQKYNNLLAVGLSEDEAWERSKLTDGDWLAMGIWSIFNRFSLDVMAGPLLKPISNFGLTEAILENTINKATGGIKNSLARGALRTLGVSSITSLEEGFAEGMQGIIEEIITNRDPLLQYDMNLIGAFMHDSLVGGFAGGTIGGVVHSIGGIKNLSRAFNQKYINETIQKRDLSYLWKNYQNIDISQKGREDRAKEIEHKFNMLMSNIDRLEIPEEQKAIRRANLSVIHEQLKALDASTYQQIGEVITTLSYNSIDKIVEKITQSSSQATTNGNVNVENTNHTGFFSDTFKATLEEMQQQHGAELGNLLSERAKALFLLGKNKALLNVSALKSLLRLDESIRAYEEEISDGKTKSYDDKMNYLADKILYYNLYNSAAEGVSNGATKLNQLEKINDLRSVLDRITFEKKDRLNKMATADLKTKINNLINKVNDISISNEKFRDELLKEFPKISEETETDTKEKDKNKTNKENKKDKTNKKESDKESSPKEDKDTPALFLSKESEEILQNLKNSTKSNNTQEDTESSDQTSSYTEGKQQEADKKNEIHSRIDAELSNDTQRPLTMAQDDVQGNELTSVDDVIGDQTIENLAKEFEDALNEENPSITEEESSESNIKYGQDPLKVTKRKKSPLVKRKGEIYNKFSKTTQFLWCNIFKLRTPLDMPLYMLYAFKLIDTLIDKKKNELEDMGIENIDKKRFLMDCLEITEMVLHTPISEIYQYDKFQNSIFKYKNNTLLFILTLLSNNSNNKRVRQMYGVILEYKRRYNQETNNTLPIQDVSQTIIEQVNDEKEKSPVDTKEVESDLQNSEEMYAKEDSPEPIVKEGIPTTEPELPMDKSTSMVVDNKPVDFHIFYNRLITRLQGISTWFQSKFKELVPHLDLQKSIQRYKKYLDNFYTKFKYAGSMFKYKSFMLYEICEINNEIYQLMIENDTNKQYLLDIIRFNFIELCKEANLQYLQSLDTILENFVNGLNKNTFKTSAELRTFLVETWNRYRGEEGSLITHSVYYTLDVAIRNLANSTSKNVSNTINGAERAIQILFNLCTLYLPNFVNVINNSNHPLHILYKDIFNIFNEFLTNETKDKHLFNNSFGLLRLLTRKFTQSQANQVKYTIVINKKQYRIKTGESILQFFSRVYAIALRSDKEDITTITSSAEKGFSKAVDRVSKKVEDIKRNHPSTTNTEPTQQKKSILEQAQQGKVSTNTSSKTTKTNITLDNSAKRNPPLSLFSNLLSVLLKKFKNEGTKTSKDNTNTLFLSSVFNAINTDSDFIEALKQLGDVHLTNGSKMSVHDIYDVISNNIFTILDDLSKSETEITEEEKQQIEEQLNKNIHVLHDIMKVAIRNSSKENIKTFITAVQRLQQQILSSLYINHAITKAEARQLAREMKVNNQSDSSSSLFKRVWDTFTHIIKSLVNKFIVATDSKVRAQLRSTLFYTYSELTKIIKTPERNLFLEYNGETQTMNIFFEGVDTKTDTSILINNREVAKQLELLSLFGITDESINANITQIMLLAVGKFQGQRFSQLFTAEELEVIQRVYNNANNWVKITDETGKVSSRLSPNISSADLEQIQQIANRIKPLVRMVYISAVKSMLETRSHSLNISHYNKEGKVFSTTSRGFYVDELTRNIMENISSLIVKPVIEEENENGEIKTREVAPLINFKDTEVKNLFSQLGLLLLQSATYFDEGSNAASLHLKKQSENKYTTSTRNYTSPIRMQRLMSDKYGNVWETDSNKTDNPNIFDRLVVDEFVLDGLKMYGDLFEFKNEQEVSFFNPPVHENSNERIPFFKTARKLVEKIQSKVPYVIHNNIDVFFSEVFNIRMTDTEKHIKVITQEEYERIQDSFEEAKYSHNLDIEAYTKRFEDSVTTFKITIPTISSEEEGKATIYIQVQGNLKSAILKYIEFNSLANQIIINQVESQKDAYTTKAKNFLCAYFAFVKNQASKNNNELSVIQNLIEAMEEINGVFNSDSISAQRYLIDYISSLPFATTDVFYNLKRIGKSGRLYDIDLSGYSLTDNKLLRGMFVNKSVNEHVSKPDWKNYAKEREERLILAEDINDSIKVAKLANCLNFINGFDLDKKAEDFTFTNSNGEIETLTAEDLAKLILQRDAKAKIILEQLQRKLNDEISESPLLEYQNLYEIMNYYNNVEGKEYIDLRRLLFKADGKTTGLGVTLASFKEFIVDKVLANVGIRNDTSVSIGDSYTDVQNSFKDIINQPNLPLMLRIISQFINWSEDKRKVGKCAATPVMYGAAFKTGIKGIINEFMYGELSALFNQSDIFLNEKEYSKYFLPDGSIDNIALVEIFIKANKEYLISDKFDKTLWDSYIQDTSNLEAKHKLEQQLASSLFYTEFITLLKEFGINKNFMDKSSLYQKSNRFTKILDTFVERQLTEIEVFSKKPYISQEILNKMSSHQISLLNELLEFFMKRSEASGFFSQLLSRLAKNDTLPRIIEETLKRLAFKLDDKGNHITISEYQYNKLKDTEQQKYIETTQGAYTRINIREAAELYMKLVANKADTTKVMSALYSITDEFREAPLTNGDKIFTPFIKTRETLDMMNGIQQAVIKLHILQAIANNTELSNFLHNYFNILERNKEIRKNNKKNNTNEKELPLPSVGVIDKYMTQLHNIITDTCRNLSISIDPNIQNVNIYYTQGKEVSKSESNSLEFSPFNDFLKAKDKNTQNKKHNPYAHIQEFRNILEYIEYYIYKNNDTIRINDAIYQVNMSFATLDFSTLDVPLLFGQYGEAIALTSIYQKFADFINGSMYDGVIVTGDKIDQAIKEWNNSIAEWSNYDIFGDFINKFLDTLTNVEALYYSAHSLGATNYMDNIISQLKTTFKSLVLYQEQINQAIKEHNLNKEGYVGHTITNMIIPNIDVSSAEITWGMVSNKLETMKHNIKKAIKKLHDLDTAVTKNADNVENLDVNDIRFTSNGSSEIPLISKKVQETEIARSQNREDTNVSNQQTTRQQNNIGEQPSLFDDSNDEISISNNGRENTEIPQQKDSTQEWIDKAIRIDRAPPQTIQENTPNTFVHSKTFRGDVSTYRKLIINGDTHYFDTNELSFQDISQIVYDETSATRNHKNIVNNKAANKAKTALQKCKFANNSRSWESAQKAINELENLAIGETEAERIRLEKASGEIKTDENSNTSGYTKNDTYEEIQDNDFKNVSMSKIREDLSEMKDKDNPISLKNQVIDVVDGFLSRFSRMNRLGLSIKQAKANANVSASFNGMTRMYKNSRVAGIVYLNNAANQEVKLHELLHMLTDYAILLGESDPAVQNIIDNISEIQNQVFNEIQKLNEADRKALLKSFGWTEEIFNYVFTENIATEFLAYFLSNDKCMEYLSTITLAKSSNISKLKYEGNILNRLIIFFKNLLTHFSNKLNSVYIGQKGDVALFSLTQQLMELNETYLTANAISTGIIRENTSGIKMDKTLQQLITNNQLYKQNKILYETKLDNYLKVMSGVSKSYNVLSGLALLAAVPFSKIHRDRVHIHVSTIVNRMDNAKSGLLRAIARNIRRIALDTSFHIITSEFAEKSIQSISEITALKNFSQGLASQLKLNNINKVNEIFKNYNVKQTKETEKMLGKSIVSYRLFDIIRISQNDKNTQHLNQDWKDFRNLVLSDDNLETLKRIEDDFRNTIMNPKKKIYFIDTNSFRKVPLTMAHKRQLYNLIRNFAYKELVEGKINGNNLTGINNIETMLQIIKDHPQIVKWSENLQLDTTELFNHDNGANSIIQNAKKLAAAYAIIKAKKTPEVQALAKFLKEEDSNTDKLAKELMVMTKTQENININSSLYANDSRALYSEFYVPTQFNNKVDVQRVDNQKDFEILYKLGYRPLQFNKKTNRFENLPIKEDIRAYFETPEKGEQNPFFQNLLKKGMTSDVIGAKLSKNILMRRISNVAYTKDTSKIINNFTAKGFKLSELFKNDITNNDFYSEIARLTENRAKILQIYASNAYLTKEEIGKAEKYRSYFTLSGNLDFEDARHLLDKDIQEDLYQTDTKISTMLGEMAYNGEINKTNYEVRRKLLDSLVELTIDANNEAATNPLSKNDYVVLISENSKERKPDISYDEGVALFSIEGMEYLTDQMLQHHLSDIKISRDMLEILRTQAQNVNFSQYQSRLREAMPYIYKGFKYIAYGLSKLLYDIKTNIIIRNPKVVVSNAGSNFTSLVGFGVPAREIAFWSKKGTSDLASYYHMLLKMQDIELKKNNIANKKSITYIKLDNEYRNLKNRVENSEIRELLQAGFWSNIITDLQTQHIDKNMIDASLDRLGLTGNMRKAVKFGLDTYLFTPDSLQYQIGELVNNYSDFVARYVLYKHKCKTMSKARAKEIAMDTYINYNRPFMTPLFRVLEALGITSFLRYRLGMQGALMKAIVDNPIRGTAVWAAQVLLLPNGFTMFGSLLDFTMHPLYSYVKNPFSLTNPLGRRA